MCGICGAVGEVNEAVIRAMTAMLVHRGPDDEGYFVRPGVALGVRRLSIIDVVNGHQPIANEDGTAWVGFNGEIYNYRELRTGLATRGHRLVSQSDTEVIVHLYEEYGPAGVQLLRGMFAYAIWDDTRRRLLLVRDRLGIKPLYYAVVRGTLVFASEIKAILKYPGVRAELDPEALDLYLTLQYVAGPRTLFRGVSKLQPGHYLVFEDGRAEIRRYWDVVFAEGERGRSVDLAEAADEFRDILEDAVRRHMISDVPVGALLSGGIDSSSVVALMSRGGTESVQTFSVGFDIPGIHNELPRARAVARHFGTTHHETVVKPDVERVLSEIAWHLDEPIADPAAVPTYLLCKAVRQHVPVVLTGEGGDEVLAGYPRYAWFLMAKTLGRLLPSMFRRPVVAVGRRLPLPGRYAAALQNVLGDRSDVDRHIAWIASFDPTLSQAVLSPEFRSPFSATRELIASHLGNDSSGMIDLVSRLVTLDMHTWLVDDILTKVDKMSMAASVEARVPFLDDRLVEFVLSLPSASRQQTLGTKRLLRDAMAQVLPRATLKQRKQAFLVPVDQWLRGHLAGFLRETLVSKAARERGWFRLDQVERLIERHQTSRASDGRPLWNLLSLELWARQFLDGATSH